jgi:hypothetical protein
MASTTFLTKSAFVFEGGTFVGDITWFTESGLNRKSAETRARDVGVKLGEDAYVTRAIDAKNVQFGTINSSETTKKAAAFSVAMLVAAAGAARKLPTTWAGAFELAPGKSFFISIRDNAIMPDGDRIVTREIAEQLLLDAMARGVETIIAAPEFAVPGARAFDLADFVSVVKNRAAPEFKIVRPGDKATRSSRIIFLPIVLVLIATLVGGAWYWWEAEQEKSRIALAALRAKEAALKKNTVRTIQAPSEWEGKADPSALFDACWATAQKAPSAPAGWAFKEIACTDLDSALTYTRPPGAGTLDALMAAVPAATVDESGNSVSARTKFVGMPIAAKSALPSSADSKAFFIDLAQRAFLTFSLSQATSPKPPPPQPGETFVPPTWQYRTYTLDGPMGDAAAIASVLRAPGLRISKITINSASTKVEGTLYAK